MNALLRTKSIAQVMSQPPDEEGHHTGLKRVLGARDLIALGIGAIIGAGIFATTGTAAAGGGGHVGAGPAIVISYILVAIACGFCALCYAEFASVIPIAGSAYTYAYVTLGELAAWIIGWDLILEYAVGNVAVAISWAGYFNSFVKGFGIHISDKLMTATTTSLHEGHGLAFNFPALAIVLLMTVLLVRGVKESITFNNIVVLIKLAVLVFFVGLGFMFVDTANWSNFAPNGWKGIHGAAAVIFFAYIGFDAVSTAAEETENPSRNLPIGMIGSLVICTILYIAISLVMTGMGPWNELGTPDPMATALEIVQKRPGLSASSAKLLSFSHFVVTVGALFSMTAVLLVFQLGQPRIFFSMARDGLLPKFFAAIHPVYQTPHVTTILTGVLVAGAAAFMDIAIVIDLCNIGTLFAFVIVCAAVLLLRYRDGRKSDSFIRPYDLSAYCTLALAVALTIWGITTPSHENRLTAMVCAPIAFWVGLAYRGLPLAPGRPFTAPFAPLIPMCGIVTCVWLMMASPFMTWVRFFVWLVVGMVIYLIYGMHHSALNFTSPAQPPDIGFGKPGEVESTPEP
ncbi:MAG: amino acid permease [Candidatus Eremiobacteraeota bacterium]|nr:amino acid permease [Candidatus Eremiobacteraeota bacterium]MCW5868544.1 amino acid permease [Candidatus Eremiobacteraeota bacterium]